MIYNIIQSNSRGNGTIIEDIILIDCGITFKQLKEYYKDLKLVLLTHIHGDHFNKKTIKRLAKERPTLRFGCSDFLVGELLELGVIASNIDIYEYDKSYNYGICKINSFILEHDVPNTGYKINLNDENMLYATDTNIIHTKAYNYDLYLVEANYELDELLEKIREKEINGQFIYEYDVMKNHMDKKDTDEWLMENIGDKSKYEYMHGHVEKGDTNE